VCDFDCQPFPDHYLQAKAEFSFRKTAEKTVALGQRLDIVFSLIRIGFFHGDTDLVVRNIDKAKSLLEGGGDWDRRNKLKVRAVAPMRKWSSGRLAMCNDARGLGC
jgi:hypothetical protein